MALDRHGEDRVRRSRFTASLGLLALLVAGCGAPPPAEQRILATLDEMEDALEAGEVGEFMAPIAEDFIADNGALDRRALGLLVRRERMARSRIAVTRYDPVVELHDQRRATATFGALATGGSGLLPDEGQLWRVETRWRLDDGDWRMIGAGWRRALGDRP
ncbi:nuclear transport factor 2 family protein [Wenzhouxiangella sp. XN79A]|uniref:nuclear transport factor 2 family protein n=1 Tax=Wenzhouxiangella sp. XN79A TaxID=2724193 RepID=UPI00144AB3B8|nr:nuclear transport factor 2 family protein [Wenzhouxiangella sp. XN79A]NKI34542.1 nuclear transport factor 2 family protein [Wenzhouxiangella sp. XN79A]